MNTKLIFAILASVALPGQVFAQTLPTTAAPNPNLKRELIEQKQQLVKTTRAQFQTAVTQIKDVRKKAIVEKVDSRIATVDQIRTANMTKQLTQIKNVLDKLDLKIATASTAGKDVTVAKTAMSSARNAWTVAQTAVTAQAAKTYTPSISTDTTLKTVVSSTVKGVVDDLKNTHQLVIAARQAAVDVAKAVAKIQNYEKPTT